MKRRILSLLLLAALCLTAFAGCTAPSDAPDTTDTSASETTVSGIPSETAEPSPVFDGLIIDGSYRIVIMNDASEIIRNTADMMAAALKEKAGLELSIVTDAETATEHEIVLGPTNRVYYTADLGWNVFLDGESLYIHSNDHTLLYFAAEAILETWLTPDFGLTAEGTLILPESRVAELNGLPTKRDNSIKVLTQNVRYADDPNRNTVQLRSRRFLNLLKEYQPDLIGCQEFTGNWRIWLEKNTKKDGGEGILDGYGVVICFRDGRNKTDGESNPIFYRLDRFELLDSDTTWLSDTPDTPSCVPNSLCNRICTWALLKDKRTGETILFANTHLDHGTDEVRSQQMTILMDYLADRIGQYPFYLAGDFNCRRGSEAYETATARLLDAHKTGWTDLSTETRTYHAYTEDSGSEIDFIFHNDITTPIRYEIVSKPYEGYVSDHFGVFTEFVNVPQN